MAGQLVVTEDGIEQVVKELEEAVCCEREQRVGHMQNKREKKAAAKAAAAGSRRRRRVRPQEDDEVDQGDLAEEEESAYVANKKNDHRHFVLLGLERPV